MGLEQIKHVVVVMMENRSFDNLLGWLYGDAGNRPPANIPPTDPPTFDRLVANKFANRLAAPGSPDVFASRPPNPWPGVANANHVPTPEPQEEVDHVSGVTTYAHALTLLQGLSRTISPTVDHAPILP